MNLSKAVVQPSSFNLWWDLFFFVNSMPLD